MKIVYIATASIPSHTANSIQVMKVCQALAQNGETVELIVPGHHDTDWGMLMQHYGVSTKFPILWLCSWKPLKRFDFIFRSLLRAKQEKVDIVYTRMIWVAIGAQWFHLPVILELHEVPSGRFGERLYKNITKSTNKKKIVFITNALRRITEGQFQCAALENEVIVAPDGVDIERYTDLPDPPTARKILGIHEIPTAVYSGGFYEGRGLDTLFTLAQAFPEIQFLWIGGNQEIVAQWNERIRSQGIKNIILTGFVANNKLPLYQAAADILLMPYGKIIAGSSGGNIADVSSPMKMFEYMAVGRAIITSDLEVLREVLSEANAVFYNSEDFLDLKLKFSNLMKNPQHREVLGRQARNDVQQYTWQLRMARIIKSFNEVV